MAVDHNKYCSYGVGDEARTSYTLSKCGRCSPTKSQHQAKKNTSLFSFPLFPASLHDARDDTQGLENAKQELCLGAMISTVFAFLGHPIPFLSSGEVPGNWTRSFLQTLHLVSSQRQLADQLGHRSWGARTAPEKSTQ